MDAELGSRSVIVLPDTDAEQFIVFPASPSGTMKAPLGLMSLLVIVSSLLTDVTIKNSRYSGPRVAIRLLSGLVIEAILFVFLLLLRRAPNLLHAFSTPWAAYGRSSSEGLVAELDTAIFAVVIH